MSPGALPASFRDPAGFLFRRDGVLYRQVNEPYRASYDELKASGLYDELVKAGLLVPHEEVGLDHALTPGAYKVLAPRLVPFISYPYEWSFSQLKDAALLTLELQQRALARKLSLRDASAYNVQFLEGRPVFIDTLSFEPLRAGAPWVAYRQFCQHFLAPLALMSRRDVRLGQLLRVHIDGVPLDLASALLPATSKWSLSLGLHIHMHAKSQRKYAGQAIPKQRATPTLSERQLLGLIDGLRSAVEGLTWKPGGSEWFDYYQANNNYGDAGLAEKERLLGELLDAMAPRTVWDLGANVGRFSRVAAQRGANVVSWDIDPGCVEASYGLVRRERETRVLPLLLDLTNPSPGAGWDNTERASLAERGPADLVLALGLVHHLAIANNTPLPQVSALMRKLGKRLVIELVPKSDSQVQKLLATREDIFPTYDRAGFEAAFAEHFAIERALPIPGTERTLYAMTGK